MPALSLVVEHPFAKVTLERCIGGFVDRRDAQITLLERIVDAGGEAVACRGLLADSSAKSPSPIALSLAGCARSCCVWRPTRSFLRVCRARRRGRRQ
jgi:hypothetical protein